jgi:hypothetical protein
MFLFHLLKSFALSFAITINNYFIKLAININNIDVQVYENKNAYVNVDDVLAFTFNQNYNYYLTILHNNGFLFPINDKAYVPENIICNYLMTWGKQNIAKQLTCYINMKK